MSIQNAIAEPRTFTFLPTILIVYLLMSANAWALDGEAVYNSTCKTCHATGLMNAPKFGDKAAWAARLSKGIATLEANAIKGFKGDKGIMPPKGGNPKLSDDDVKAGVAYMLNAAK